MGHTGVSWYTQPTANTPSAADTNNNNNNNAKTTTTTTSATDQPLTGQPIDESATTVVKSPTDGNTSLLVRKNKAKCKDTVYYCVIVF